MEESVSRGKSSIIYRIWDLLIYAFSVISVTTFMFHFWVIDMSNFGISGADPLSSVYPLWGIAGAFAIFSVFSGIIRRAEVRDNPMQRGMVTAAAVVGCIVLLGLTISATMLIVPLSLNTAFY